MKVNDKRYKEKIKDICEECDMMFDECDTTSSWKCDTASSEGCDTTSSRKCNTTSSEGCDVTSSGKCNMTSSDECDTTSSRECNITSDDYDMTCESNCKNKEKPHVSINCNLRVELDNKNRAIYLCPRRVQYFTFKVLKSCGEVWINHKGNRHCSEMVGRLGRYKIVGNGVVVYTKCKLNPRDVDILHFTVIDRCTDSCINFAAVFSYNPCNCCKECNK